MTQDKQTRSKRWKRLRVAGLIGLTLIVVAAVALTVWAVNRSSVEPVWGNIGERIEVLDLYAIRVADVRFEDVYADADDLSGSDRVYCVVDLELEASDRVVQIKDTAFSIGDAHCDCADGQWQDGTLRIDAGQTTRTQLAWIVERDSMTQLVLRVRHVSVRLGVSARPTI